VDITIYDKNLTPLGIVDVYESLIWTRRYFQNGSFELVAPASASNLKLLKKRNILEIENEDEVAYIDTINITQDEEKGTIIKAVGAFYSGKLSRKVILNSATNLKDLIENNLRGLAITVNSDVSNITFNNSVVGKNLGEVIEALARRENFGYKIVLENKSLVFKIFQGIDKSIEQSENPRVIFSQEYENLHSCEYFNSDVGAINTVYARCKLPAGIEPCTPPTYDIIAEGEQLEAYIEVDAVTYDVTLNDETKTYLNYNATLANMKAEAEKLLVPIQENFEGKVAFKSNYKTDFDLGDVVTVFNDEWDTKTSQRITEVTEVYDNTENSVIPTFGIPARTILDIIKE